jgi:short-subunit dehydrogenase
MLTTAPPNVHYFHCDLASPAAIKATAAEVQKHLGHPTILINNAGFARGKTIMTTTDSDLKLTFQINTISHYQLAREFLPKMIETNHGMVVTVASLAAYVSAPALVDYAASKAAALVFHEGLQAELATIYNAPKVRTVVCCQGYTNTALFQGFDKGDGFLTYTLDPETVAERIVKAVLAGQSDHIILPRGSVLMTLFKGFPTWMQVGFRKDLRKLMQGWSGRQVLQPSEVESTGEESVFEKIEAV